MVVREPAANEYESTPTRCKKRQRILSENEFALMSPKPTVVMVVTAK
jgi:hypothetical protein